MNNPNKLKMHSPNLTQGNLARIRELFPNCVTEASSENGKVKLAVDFDLLRQELSESIVEGPQERYQLNWPGKREALLTANAPIAKTLRPCREESVDFDNTKNLFIEGDNLDALKLLQETYLGKVKMIYIDPPYNTGNDFIYEDDFAENTEEFLRRSNQKDDDGNRLVTNTQANGRFHSDWLSMMYPRLKLARNLLRDDGVIFISIGESELSNCTKLCTDIFGVSNSIGLVNRVMKSGGNKGRFFSPNIDYVVVFAKDIHNVTDFKISIDESIAKKLYSKTENSGPRKGERYRPFGLYQSSLDSRPNQRYYIECPDGTLAIPPGKTLPTEKKDAAKVIPSSTDGCWRWSQERYIEEKLKSNIVFTESNNNVLLDENGDYSRWNIYTKIWLSERMENGQTPTNLVTKFENRHSAQDLKDIDIPFDFAKPVALIKYLIGLNNIYNDIIFDFFSGSSTTAHAVMQLNAEDGGNRQFIMVQIPEETPEDSPARQAGYNTIAEIGKERIRRAGAKIKAELEQKNAASGQGSLLETDTQREQPLDIGFRVLNVDSSNMADVYYTPDVLNQEQLRLHTENIKSGRTPEDLLFQVLLDWGVDLTLPIRKETILGKTVFFVDENALVACFDTGLTEELVKELARTKPLRVVFRDNGFSSDAVKINATQIFRQLSPGTEVKAI